MIMDSLSGSDNRVPHQADLAKAASSLVANASIEATPKQIADLGNKAPDWMQEGMRIYVPALPNADFGDAIKASETLLAWGMKPVPHLPARIVPDTETLTGWLASMQRIGVKEILLIAGDTETPAGPFPDTLALIKSGLLSEYGLTGFGVAGHPEGHPHADDEALLNAMRYKRDYAVAHDLDFWVVTQFSFDEESLISWLDRHQAILESVPVYLGLAGPTRLKNLLAYAAQCGVATSAKALSKNMNAMRLLRPWKPDALFQALSKYKASHSATPLQGVHLFPFGGLQQSNQWLSSAHLLVS
ncbi:methylenetetrahydrofolate reductase [Enterovibrio coralii]|uniref:Methylenetetrahydrofolate reductase n=1 Tax=Enterovibrio coralii TaxID=294935 RepID=A0A135IAY4_9GAMM|nr:methylenetetrahydrofolate reductase [Enterovibrio coralii]KXF82599.1 methylenetetrahydrofolate reductase [Enterovibrio coralii]